MQANHHSFFCLLVLCLGCRTNPILHFDSHRDPSKLTKSNINKLWHHWEQREKNNKVVLCFIGAKPDDMPAPSNKKPKRQMQKKAYVEIDCESSDYGDDDDDYSGNNSEDEDNDKDGSGNDHDHGTSHSPMCPAGSSTATKCKDSSSIRRTPLLKPRPAGKSLPAKGKVGSLNGSKDRPLPGLVNKPSSIKPSSPVAHKGDRGTFLCGLSTDPQYVALLEKMYLLPPFL